MEYLSVLLLSAVALILSSGDAFSDVPTEEWVARYNGSGSDYDQVIAIVLDDRKP